VGDPFVVAGYLITYGVLGLYALSLIVRLRRASSDSDEV
jgi:hypothetical protein